MTVCCDIVLIPKNMNCTCEIKSIPTQSTYIGKFGGEGKRSLSQERGGRRVEAMLSGVSVQSVLDGIFGCNLFNPGFSRCGSDKMTRLVEFS
jgi:hypothetical protein